MNKLNSSTGDNVIRQHEADYNEGVNSFYQVALSTSWQGTNIFMSIERYVDEERVFYLLAVEDLIVDVGGNPNGGYAQYIIERSTATGAFYNFDKQTFSNLQ